jgi:hypothetical protein
MVPAAPFGVVVKPSFIFLDVHDHRVSTRADPLWLWIDQPESKLA